jgi:hypothetical protein
MEKEASRRSHAVCNYPTSAVPGLASWKFGQFLHAADADGKRTLPPECHTLLFQQATRPHSEVQKGKIQEYWLCGCRVEAE